MAAFGEDREVEEEEYEEYEEIPDDEKLAICTSMLLSSPPGQIERVLKDLKVLCPEHILTDEVLQEVFRKYNKENLQVMEDSKGRKVIVSPETEVDPDHYLYSKEKTVVKVDHMAQKIVEEECAEGEEKEEAECFSTELEEQRGAVEHQLSQYLASQYGRSTSVVDVTVKDGDLHIHISGEKVNDKNYWAGNWNATYRFTVSSLSLEGTVKILIHYYEEGNVQMNTNKTVQPRTLDVEGDDVNTIAKGLVEEIARAESSIQESLETMYANMGDETFKDMRRMLPISKMKMDWSGAQMNLAKGIVTKK